MPEPERPSAPCSSAEPSPSDDCFRQTESKRGRRPVKDLPLPLVLIILAALLIAVMMIALCAGRFSISAPTAFHILLSNVIPQPLTWTNNEFNVIMSMRLPRVLAAVLVGMALALSGASYQGVFQNPLVSPDILGVSYGACVGAALSILLYLSSWQTQLFAFFGGLIAVGITVTIPKLMHRHSNVVMVLAGIIVGGFMSSVLGLMKYVADPDTQLADITYWQLGSIAKVTYGTLAYTAPIILIAAAVIIGMRWRLNILSLGEDEARTLGVDILRERGIIIVASTVLTASAVSLSGTIGWIGLIIPHVTRRIVGSDNKRLIPCTALVSAMFLLVIDTIARTATGYEIPLGILTGLIGAPIFGYLLIKQRDID